ncbi:hypothetical protein T439DRAFT_381413 [Meredithblackwellia eburnea MCA 4105]
MLIKNVNLVGLDGVYDLVISKGCIAAISRTTGGDLATSSSPTSNLPEGEQEVVDGKGKVWVGPGLRDAHTHFSTWALTQTRLDLSSATSAKETGEMVLARYKEPSEDPSAVLVGRDFRVGKWPDIESMTKEYLDSLIPDRPVALMSGDLHSLWANSLGLRFLGVDPVSSTGVLFEKAAFDAMGVLNNVPMDQLDAAVDASGREAAALGVTHILDLEMVHNMANWTRRVDKGFKWLRVRVGMYCDHIQDAISRGLKSGDLIPEGKGLLTVGPYKIVTDGSLGARTAYCHDPYPGTKDDYGLWIYPTQTLHAMATYGTKHNLQLAIHAIGDRANALVLDTFSKLDPPPLPGSSIEHAQLVSVEDFPSFAKLDLIASVQPEHLNDDKELSDRFWGCRSNRAFAYRSLEDAGARLALGSDAPVAALNPWGAMAAALSRERPGEEGQDGAAWHPEQCLSSNKVAWKWSTWTDEVSIKVGDAADMCILADDPLVLDAKALRHMKVLGTLLGGDWTFKSADLS